EAAFGLGEVVVSGQVEPDTYVVAKDGPRLVSTRVGHQTHRLDGTPAGEVERHDLSPEAGAARVLSDDEVVALARLGLQVEEHYGEPQDVEWAIQGTDTYLVQSRPITTLGPARPAGTAAPAGRVLLQGLAASTGVASG